MKHDLSAFEIDRVCQAAHEVNRSWQLLMGDTVDPHFDKLPEDDKQTVRNSIIGVIINDFGAEQAHSAWVAEKKSKGWTVGATKDIQTKTHPCLVSWNELPMAQQVKDKLWIDTVRNFTKYFWTIDKQ